MSLTKESERYIQAHPSIQKCLRDGIVNYSSLARRIMQDTGMQGNFDAILVACRRYRAKITHTPEEKDITAILQKSKIEVKNKIASFVLARETPFSKIEHLEKFVRKDGESIRLIEGISALTLVVPEDYAKAISLDFRNHIIRKMTRLVEVTLRSSKEIESTPGVISFLYSLLAEYQINIVETFSCWTDTIFIIDEKDLAKVMSLLRF